MSEPSEARRRFLNILIGGGLLGWMGSVLYPIFSFLKPPEVAEANVGRVSAGKASEIANNSGQIVRFGRAPVLLIRTETGEFRAFSATCTHLDCIVQYRPDLQHIWCACHGGQFDLQGRNAAGPPPKPLASYDVTVINDEVFISRREPSA